MFMMTTVVDAPVRSGLSRALLLVLAVGTLGVLLSLPVVGCIEQETVECAGGIRIGDKCFPQCEADKCLEGNICVGHLCRLVCHSHRDCDWPRQECRPPAADQKVTGDAALTAEAAQFGACTDVGRVFADSTFGTPCPDGGECWGTVCPNGLECDVNACPDGAGVPHPEQCVPDVAACGGVQPCNIGTCGEEGPPCVVVTCPYNECTPLHCLSAGQGDADAYCTRHDCQQDSDCPGGWYCGVTRDPHDICGPTCVGGSCSDDGDPCTLDGECQKGNNRSCGTTDEPCIQPNDFNLDGRSLFEGGLCLLRRTCLKREPCARCTSHVDCSGDSQMLCSDIAGQHVCTKICGDDGDCLRDETCMPSYPTCERTVAVGCGDLMPESPACPHLPCLDGICRMADGTLGPGCSTSAECPLEGCVGRSVCVPSMGACRGDGGFCEHCVDDTDCGVSQPAGRWACQDLGEGERVCFDYSFSDVCAGGLDSECPASPSGAHGECQDEDAGAEPGDSVYHRCYFPYQSDEYSCWP